MNIVRLSVQGSSPWNEDALVAREEFGVFGVIDGATSLVPFTGAGGETGGYLAAGIIAGTMHRLLDEWGTRREPAFPLADALLEANRLLREEMMKHGIRTDRKEELWSAGAAMIRVTDTAVHYAQAGDCMLTAVYTDGTIRVVTRDQIAHLDRETHRLWAEGVASGLASREALWSHVLPQIVQGRQSANTPSGYGVLNGEPEAADYLEHGRINRINLKALLLMTDGLYAPKRAEEPMFDPVEVTARVAQIGLERYVEWLVGMEEGDPDCRLYPRVKKSDDKTAIWIEL